ncbi:uncharacterized protein LOC132749458 [Ruditapes philippinarum]|uniref:uncharacterized protein LOC132749458 n=1 Tax=Ruditapes philippinarum TaxID=129788 RepID=UPI00295A82B6|nr:uncharacterized protein LOC132749458 [Ruditapes philippinarum]
MELFLSSVFQCNGTCQETSITPDERRTNDESLKQTPAAYSFMFVREPYARLFSAYENKLFLPNKHWIILGIDIIKTVRPRASLVSRTLGHDVTFLELVKYVIYNYEHGITLNSHLQPMHMYCNTCNFQYSFIGKLETMSSDLVDLIDYWKHNSIVPKNVSSAAEIEAHMLYKRSFGPYKHMFMTLKKYGEILSRYKLFQRTWSSYHIRGLILKKFRMPFGESEVNNVGYVMFGNEIKSAIDKSLPFKEDLKAQREEALVQAYSTVPFELMTKLKEFMKLDCLLFDYETMPKIIFDKISSNNSFEFDYFKGL